MQYDKARKKLFVLLRDQTGHDFSRYKLTMVDRRIHRRMVLHQLDTMEEYIEYANATPAEVDALFHFLLIGVTGFFRDPEAFAALEERVVPELFAGKGADDSVRVWVPGCSTGEEAYSIAMLLAERQQELGRHFNVRVFATDIDAQAVATARMGLYPSSAVADIAPGRLARFFTAETEGGSYRINKAVRGLVAFSEQDVIKDTPFPRLDLVSCRNLLIYMNADLQKDVIPLFHRATNPGGFLFLGTSETNGGQEELFTPMDRKYKIYQSKGLVSAVSCRAGGIQNFCKTCTAP